MLLSDLLYFFTTIHWKEKSKTRKLGTSGCDNSSQNEAANLQATNGQEGYGKSNTNSVLWATASYLAAVRLSAQSQLQ